MQVDVFTDVPVNSDPPQSTPPLDMIYLGDPPEGTERRCLVSAVVIEPSLLRGVVPLPMQLQTKLTQFVAEGTIIQQSTKNRWRFIQQST